MKRITTILIALSIVITAKADADVKAVRGQVEGGYNFWLSTPECAKAEDADLMPLVVFLHGSSLCGNDLNKVLRYGTISAVKKGLDIDAYVIAPQNPGGAWKPEKVMACIDYVCQTTGAIDQTRIYVIGMSLGGYGTIDMAATYPGRIAAAIGMCGGASVSDVSGLNDMPLWIIHGTGDTAVSVRESDKVVERMKASDASTPRLIYSRVPGMNHSAPARLFYMPEIYEWLFSHSLEDYDRCTTQGFPINTTMMQDAYRNCASRKVSLSTLGQLEKMAINYDFSAK